ncbi:MAG: hypothetical protein H0Z32_08420 [Bacillaceae bacterium]|nr:hypothetical protein [Bacillaceae bacterium]
MHIPAYYKKREVQYFFAGAVIGGIIAYIIFLYMYGSQTERWIEENVQLHSRINDLERENQTLTKDKANLKNKNEQILTIQTIDVELINAEQLKLDRFVIYQLTEAVKNELSSLIGKSIQSVSENQALIYATIENKTFKVDDFAYEAKVSSLTISRTLHAKIKISISKSSMNFF